MRLSLAQTELMVRLKGQVNQQKIVVERVDVGAGGQAVIASVTAGGGVKNED